MGFLDNSGDIILDAVLTDTGRLRLSRGDGSFKIAKFALGDDEINYGNYNANDLSGSAYYDLDILKTPVFEAFTNNTSNMNSKLLSISRTNLLFLPVIKLSTILDSTQTYAGGVPAISETFLITVDPDTTTEVTTNTLDFPTSKGIILGSTNIQASSGASFIRLDQGLDNPAGQQGPSPAEPLDADLLETQYIVEMDNRFGMLYGRTGATAANANFVDDDNIASYFLARGLNEQFVSNLLPSDTQNCGNAAISSLSGPRGTSLQFQIKSSINLSSANNLFETLGSTMLIGSTTYLTIDTTIRVTGATTGYRVDVPVRYIKKQ